MAPPARATRGRLGMRTVAALPLTRARSCSLSANRNRVSKVLTWGFVQASWPVHRRVIALADRFYCAVHERGNATGPAGSGSATLLKLVSISIEVDAQDKPGELRGIDRERAGCDVIQSQVVCRRASAYPPSPLGNTKRQGQLLVSGSLGQIPRLSCWYVSLSYPTRR